jgi:PAS domain S-box-containing protein
MPTTLRRDEQVGFPVQVALGYAALSVVWIIVWDRLIAASPIDERVLVMTRRTMYVGATAFFLWWLVRREVRRIDGLRARFDAIADQDVVGVYISRAYRFLYVNDSLIKMTGYTREDLMSRPTTDLLDPSELERARSSRWGGDHSGPERYLARRADGSTMLVDVIRRRVELEDGAAYAGIILNASRAEALEPRSRSNGGVHASAATALAESTAAARAATNVITGWRSKHTVLVVDDEPAVRRVIAAALRRQGYHVVEAPDGPTALEKFDSGEARIDLVICDFLLPGHTGLAIVNQMMAQRSDLKVLFVTGYNRKDLMERQPDLVAYPFIEKPFSVEDLTTSVDRMWEAASA